MKIRTLLDALNFFDEWTTDWYLSNVQNHSKIFVYRTKCIAFQYSLKIYLCMAYFYSRAPSWMLEYLRLKFENWIRIKFSLLAAEVTAECPNWEHRTRFTIVDAYFKTFSPLDWIAQPFIDPYAGLVRFWFFSAIVTSAFLFCRFSSMLMHAMRPPDIRLDVQTRLSERNFFEWNKNRSMGPGYRQGVLQDCS